MHLSSVWSSVEILSW